MFNFTTTNVINSDKDLTTGEPLWTTDEDKEGNKIFNLKRVNKYNAKNVKSIYKAVAHDAENAKVTINFTDITAKQGDQLRLSLYIGLSQQDNDSRYANDMIYKGKPFTVEFLWNGAATAVVKKLAETINQQELFVYGDKILKVSYSGAYLTLEAVDEFQRFRKVNVEHFDPTAHHYVGEYTAVKSLDNLNVVDSAAKLTGTVEGIFGGKEGFGTYTFITRNLRLPTDMRVRAFGINQDETPIAGFKYNQFTIHYCVDQGVLGTNSIGDVVTALTDHVFYVREDLSDDFELALADIAPEAGVITFPKG